MTFLSQLAGYTLHTGSSWRGPIGRSEIVVTFERAPNRTLRVIALDSLKSNPKLELYQEDAAVARMVTLMKKWGNVVYSGPGRPHVQGNTLRWIRTHWRPTIKDDISFWFKMP